MIIDHIGIVVKSIEKAIEHWTNVFGYHQITEPVINSRQKVRVVFMEKTDSMQIKLVEPLDETSPAHPFLMKGGGLHHLCFKCKNMGDEIGRLKEHRLRVLAMPQPGEAFENEEIAFVYAKQGLNIELIETEKRANLLDKEE